MIRRSSCRPRSCSPKKGDAIRDSFHKLVVGITVAAYQSDRPVTSCEEFQFVQVARKVVGVGSVGTRVWILLMVGLGNGTDPLHPPSQRGGGVRARGVSSGKERLRQPGERVVAGQHLMQAASDIFLGCQPGRRPRRCDRDFYLRQLRDWKGSELEGADALGPHQAYVGLCAQALARAHARSGDRIAIASYLGNGPTFDRALADFAEAYADQNERDYGTLQAAVKDGRAEATTDI